MLEFNVGELATRLRSGLGVRGRIPLGLDEHVVPTVSVADVSGAPFRRSVFRISGGTTLLTGTVGEHATLGVQWDPVRALGATFVVDRIDVSRRDIITATGAPSAKTGYVGVSLLETSPTPSVIAPNVRGLITEVYPPSLAIANYLSLLSTYLQPAVSIAGLQTRTLAAGGVEGIHQNCEFVLLPNMNLVAWSDLAADATNSSGLIFSWSGLLYPLAIA